MKKMLGTIFTLFIFLSLFVEVSSQDLLIIVENPEEKTYPGGEIEYKIILDYTAAEKDEDDGPGPTYTYTPPTSTPPNPCPPPTPDSSSGHLEIGAKRASVTFSIEEAPEGWEVDFKYGVKRYLIEPEEIKEVFLIAKVPKDVELGTYMIIVRIISDVGRYEPLELEAEIVEKDLEVLTIQYSPEDPKDGEVVSIMAQVRNNSPQDHDVETRLLVDYNTIDWQTIPIPSGDTKSVVFTWTAVEGDHTLGVHAMELPREPDRSNNTQYANVSVIKLPIGEADSLFQQANTYYYNGEFAKAKEYYGLARDLYEQIPNEDRISQCNTMIGKCEKHLEALALIDQAENAFEEEDCAKAIELYNRAITIYEELNDNTRMEEAKERLREIEDECAPPPTTVPPTTPPPSFWQKHKKLLIGAVVVIILALLYILNELKKQKEKKEKPKKPQPILKPEPKPEQKPELK
jgi:tetratricopeptide (TPR) repeat protein